MPNGWQQLTCQQDVMLISAVYFRTCSTKSNSVQPSFLWHMRDIRMGDVSVGTFCERHKHETNGQTDRQTDRQTGCNAS